MSDKATEIYGELVRAGLTDYEILSFILDYTFNENGQVDVLNECAKHHGVGIEVSEDA